MHVRTVKDAGTQSPLPNRHKPLLPPPFFGIWHNPHVPHAGIVCLLFHKLTVGFLHIPAKKIAFRPKIRFSFGFQVYMLFMVFHLWKTTRYQIWQLFFFLYGLQWIHRYCVFYFKKYFTYIRHTFLFVCFMFRRKLLHCLLTP